MSPKVHHSRTRCLVIGASRTGPELRSIRFVRGLAWGIDGTALIVAAALLAVHCLRRTTSPFRWILSSSPANVGAFSAMSLEAGHPLFAAGARSGRGLPHQCRQGHASGCARLGRRRGAAVALPALQVFTGRGLTPLSEPLRFWRPRSSVHTVRFGLVLPSSRAQQVMQRDEPLNNIGNQESKDIGHTFRVRGRPSRRCAKGGGRELATGKTESGSDDAHTGPKAGQSPDT